MPTRAEKPGCLPETARRRDPPQGTGNVSTALPRFIAPRECAKPHVGHYQRDKSNGRGSPADPRGGRKAADARRSGCTGEAHMRGQVCFRHIEDS